MFLLGCSGERWQQFQQTDLLTEALRLLDKGHMDQAFTLWIRHQAWHTGIPDERRFLTRYSFTIL